MVLVGAAIAIFAAFLPWFEITAGIGVSQSAQKISGFSRFAIFGVLSSLFAVAGGGLLVREIATGKKSFLSIKNEVLQMGFFLEAIFTLLISFFIFASFFRDFSRAEFRFGIFLSLVAHITAFLGAYFSFAEIQKAETKSQLQSLSDEDLQKLNLQPEVPEEQMSLGETEN